MKLNREEKIAELVQKWSDAMDLGDLISFFEEKQKELLDELSDDEINKSYKQNILNEEDFE